MILQVLIAYTLQSSMVMSSQQIQLLITPARWKTSFRTSPLSIMSMVLQWVTILHRPLGPGGFSATIWSTSCQRLVDGTIPYVYRTIALLFLSQWGLIECNKKGEMVVWWTVEKRVRWSHWFISRLSNDSSTPLNGKCCFPILRYPAIPLLFGSKTV